jgi:hypothetical protein
MPGKTYRTSDPEVIRRWAAARAGLPAIVSSSDHNTMTATVPSIVFPDDAYPDTYTTVSWGELIDIMRQKGLVFIYQEQTESGSLSRFCQFVSQEAAAEAAVEPEPRHEPVAEATGLYQTEDLDTPQARGTEAFRHPCRATSPSWPLLIGLAVLGVLVVALIIGVFWPTS